MSLGRVPKFLKVSVRNSQGGEATVIERVLIPKSLTFGETAEMIDRAPTAIKLVAPLESLTEVP